MTYFPEIPQFNNPENVCTYVGHTMSAALDYPLLDHIAICTVVTQYRI